MTLGTLFTTGRTALLPYLTAGLPDPASSPDLFRAMARGGADGFEIGVPYSDPLMDGPVIQQASAAALAAGMTLHRAFSVIAAVTAACRLPCLAMTYANPVFRLGPDQFCRLLAESGAAGLIVPDLPVEEAAPVRAAADRHGLGMVLFVAPTSSDARIRAVAGMEPVFIYGVADLGVTGERQEALGRAGDLARRVREQTDIPLVLGVGISTPSQAAAAGEVADGVIVGSALVRRVLEASDASSAAIALEGAVRELRAALS